MVGVGSGGVIVDSNHKLNNQGTIQIGNVNNVAAVDVVSGPDGALCPAKRRRRRDVTREQSAASTVNVPERYAVSRLRDSQLGDERVGDIANYIVPGMLWRAFENDGQITKREIRAITLAALAPRRGGLLWDIGAGSGLVGLAAARAEATAASSWVRREPISMQGRSQAAATMRADCSLAMFSATAA